MSRIIVRSETFQTTLVFEMKTNHMLIIIFQKLRSSGNHSFSALQLEVVNQNLSTVNGV